MKNPPRPVVLVLMGGPDAERAVSLESGQAIAEALRTADAFEVHEWVIDRPSARAVSEHARQCGAAVVFPAIHGPWGEGGPLQQLLEDAELPYVGSRPRPAALAMDKDATKRIATDNAVATPRWAVLTPDAPCHLAPPVVVKPTDEGSSVGLRICRTDEELAEARAALASRPRVMVEQFIGGREVTVSIIGGATLPIIEIVPATEYYDYAAKYERNDTQYILHPDLPRPVARRCLAWTESMYRAMGLRDLARVDFLIDDNGPWLLEVNTMPGFTSHSLLPMAAREHGWDMPILCTMLAQTALDRGRALADVQARERRRAQA